MHSKEYMNISELKIGQSIVTAAKKDTLIDLIKHQLNIDITPFVNEQYSKPKYLTVELDEMDDLAQRAIRSLAHSSGKFRLESNGGLGEAFFYLF
jgi:hypothetical protein